MMSPDLRAPLPLGYSTPERKYNALAGRLFSKWSKLVQAESSRLDHKPRANAGMVQVVQVVQAKINITHMRARAYIYFFSSFQSLTSKFEFVRNHLDHLDQASKDAASRLDHPLGPPWTTWTTQQRRGFQSFQPLLVEGTGQI